MMTKFLLVFFVSVFAKDLNLKPVSKLKESAPPEKSVPQLEVPPLVCETKEGVFALGLRMKKNANARAEKSERAS